METTKTPFDLNEVIKQWRGSLGESPAFRQENLDELENHLRDSIANLEQRGLAADEAFIIATRRMGSDAVLGREFGKINSRNLWLNRALWMLVGVQVFACIGFLVSIVTFGTVAVGVPPLGDRQPLYTESLCAIVHLSTFALSLAVGWWLIARRGNSVTAWLHKAPRSFPRVFVLIVGCLFLLLSPHAIQMEKVFITREISLPIHFFLGMYNGTAIASLMESAALIVLTLWLARRQLFAKTWA